MSIHSETEARLASLLDKTLPDMQPLPLQESEVVIYGAGNCGRDVMGVLRARGYRVAAVLDIRANSINSVGDVPCLTPDGEPAREYARRGLPVVMAVFNPFADVYAIDQLLRQTGFERIISYYEFFERFSKNLKSTFWLAPRQFYREQSAPILDGFNLWADDVSRRIYVDLLELRLTWNLELLRRPDTEHQYFPLDIPAPRSPMRLIDGGAFVGDSLQRFLKHNIQIDAVAAFEPDMANFKRLSETVNQSKEALGFPILFPCGLGDTTRMVKFFSDGSAGSRVADEGESLIQVIAIDDVLPSFAPTLIKLDVEGAEIAALKGAAQTIYRYQPDLAICVYHSPYHLWEVPVLMRDLAPAHQLALRYHQFNDFDVVAYAYRN